MVLLNSRLWKSLGIYERRSLEALEIEHCRHAGKEKRVSDLDVRSGHPARNQAQPLRHPGFLLAILVVFTGEKLRLGLVDIARRQMQPHAPGQ